MCKWFLHVAWDTMVTNYVHWREMILFYLSQLFDSHCCWAVLSVTRCCRMMRGFVWLAMEWGVENYLPCVGSAKFSCFFLFCFRTALCIGECNLHGIKISLQCSRNLTSEIFISVYEMVWYNSCDFFIWFQRQKYMDRCVRLLTLLMCTKVEEWGINSL